MRRIRLRRSSPLDLAPDPFVEKIQSGAGEVGGDYQPDGGVPTMRNEKDDHRIGAQDERPEGGRLDQGSFDLNFGFHKKRPPASWMTMGRPQFYFCSRSAAAPEAPWPPREWLSSPCRRGR